MAASSAGSTPVVLALAYGFGAVFLARNSLGYLSPFIAQDLDLQNQRIGILAAAFALTWAVAGYSISIFGRTLSPRSLLAGLLFSLGLASVASSLAATFLILVVARLAAGLVSGPVLPLSQAQVASLGSTQHRGFRMGVVQGLGGGILGAILAPLMLVPIAVHLGWRTAFLLVAAIAVTSAVLLACVLPSTSPSIVPERKVGRTSLPPNIVLCCMISAAMVGWLILTLTFYPIYLVQVGHLSPAMMSTVMSAMGVGSVIAAFLVPYLSDRFGRRRILIMFSVVGALSPLGVLLIHDSLPLLITSVLIGSLGGGTFPLFMAVVPSESVPTSALAPTIGLIQGIGEIAGGVIAPVAGGWAADRFGLTTPLIVALVGALLAAAFSLGLRDPEGDSKCEEFTYRR